MSHITPRNFTITPMAKDMKKDGQITGKRKKDHFTRSVQQTEMHPKLAICRVGQNASEYFGGLNLNKTPEQNTTFGTSHIWRFEQH